jgi:predicted acyltransferase
MSAPALAKPNRIVSMDQFRGYTVAGMFLVNFLGHMAAVHAVLKHNDTFFSYADSIMPSFIFAVGFSYRLTILKRLPQLGAYKTYMSYFKRSMALILIVLVTAGLGSAIEHWKDFDRVPENYAGPPTETKSGPPSEDGAKKGDDSAKKGEGKRGRRGKRAERGENDEKPKWNEFKIPDHFGLKWRIVFLKLLKADMWEVLSIIGVCQIVIMPVIAKAAWVRALALVACMLGHAAITWNFNWGFENGLDSLYRISQPGGEDKYAHGVGGIVEAIKSDALPPDKAFALVRYIDKSMTLPDGRTIETVIERNWMDRLWQIRGIRSWDGGCFGILSWSVAMLAGTLVYDLMARVAAKRAAITLMGWGLGLMAVAYGLSCLTRLYDLEPVPGLPEITKLEKERDEEIKEIEKTRDTAIKRIPGNLNPIERVTEEERIKAEFAPKIAEVKAEYEPQIVKIREENKDGIERANRINFGEFDPETKELHAGIADRRDGKYAASPVVPNFKLAEGRRLQDLLAEPPFVQPPSTSPGDLANGKPVRVWNYWMMGKRTVNQSFMMFSVGFAVFLYGVFVILCDIGGMQVGVFRTFGMNPLAAYIIHQVTERAIQSVVPRDSPLWFCMLGFAVFFYITYLLVRGLEKQNIYIRM